MNKELLLEYFKVNESFGEKSLTIAIGEFSFKFLGLDENLKEYIEKKYSGFVCADQRNPSFKVNLGKIYKEIETENQILDFLKIDDVSILAGTYFVALRKEGENITKLNVLGGNEENLLYAIENSLRWMVSNSALSKNGLLLHASSKVINGRSHIFLGNHGAGKTTAVSLIDEGFTIADDVLLIMPHNDGRYYAYSMPSISLFEQKKEEIGSFKIEAFYKLIKSDENKLKKMSTPNAFATLVASVPFMMNTNRHHYISRNIIEKFPFYNLYFRKENNFFNKAKVNL